MKQTTKTPARKSPLHPRAAAATVTDIMRPPLTTAGQYDHVAAAAYLMKHAGTTALMVMDAHGQPAGIITQADIARAVANGEDPNDARVHAVTITRPAVTTTTSIRDAAAIMTARHLRHLPVTGAAGLLGVIDITDVCQALSTLAKADQGPAADPGPAAGPRHAADPARPHNA